MKRNKSNHKVGCLIIVDDEAELMSALCERLAEHGYETAGFTSGAAALDALKERDYDLLLTDLMMPEMDGIDLIRAAMKIDPYLVGIIMTGQGTVQTAVEAMKIGAFDYILKPFKINTILPVISRGMEVHHLRMENMQLRETVAIHELGEAIAFSLDLNPILNKIADAALQQCDADEASIMLPTSDGKELFVAVARGDHTEHIGKRIPISQGIAGWVAQNRKLVTLSGEVHDERFTPINPRAEISAAMSVPMLSGGNLVGVLNINITRRHRPFTLGQVKTLNMLVSIASPILENSRLCIEKNRAEEKYRSLVDNIGIGVSLISPKMEILALNMQMRKWFPGIDLSDRPVCYGAFNDPPREAPCSYCPTLKTLEDGQTHETITETPTKTGVVNYRFHSSPVMEAGRVVAAIEMVEDISERVLAEKRQVLTNRILETLNRPNEIINLIRDILLLLKEHTGIEAVAIRLREGEDFPYYVTNGFPPHFLEAEKYLCARDAAGEIIRDSENNPYLECMCGNILCGRTDPTLPFFTEGGSFWTNSTTELLTSTSEEDRQARTRNRCHGEGYESVALISLRSGDDVIGLLQLNDSRPDCFTEEMIQFLEGIGTSIGIAVSRRQMQIALQSSHKRLKAVLDSIDALVYVVDMQTYEILFINQYGKDVWGNIEGKTCWQTIQAGQTGPCSFCTSDRLLTGDGAPGSIYVWEFQNTVNGNWYKCLDQAISWIDGRIARMELAYDITDQKLLEGAVLRERSMVDRIMKTSPAGITVVDCEGRVVFANKRAEEILCPPTEEFPQMIRNIKELHFTGPDGKPVPHEKLPFMQVLSSGNPVYGVSQILTFPDGSSVFVSVNGAPIFGDSGRITEVVLTIDDVTEQRKADEEVKRSLEKLQKTMHDTVRAMSMIVETRDPYTSGHQERVARLAVAIARDLNLSEDRIEGIQIAGIIHDIGKMYVPAEILSKPTKLSDIEFSMVRSHAQVGYEILRTIDFPHPVADIVHQHHERMNGSGYPESLSNGGILMEARILAVADVVEAMASHRPYRPTLGIDAALEEIKKNKCILYDPEVVDACLMLFQEKGYKMEG